MRSLSVTIHTGKECPCSGVATERRSEVPEKLSLSRIAEMATETSCVCGDALSWAAVRLPAGPYVVGVCDGEVELYLARSPHFEVGSITARLGGFELDLAGMCGQPLSLRGAWGEAIFAATLSGKTVSFPAGAGMRCTVSHEPGEGRDVSRLSPWLETDLFCSVMNDEDMMRQGMLAEVRASGLVARFAGPERCLVRVPGGSFEEALYLSVEVERAVLTGVSPRLHFRSLLAPLANHLETLEGAGREIVAALKPGSVRPERGRKRMWLTFDDVSVEVDVGAYVIAGAERRRGMLDKWREVVA